MSSSSQSWKIQGDYFEACNCDVVCPCVFLGDPDRGECDVTLAWHIQNGKFGNTALNDLNVVAVFHAPGNMFTGPKWKGALYLDDRADKEQADALVSIYSGKAGGFFGVAATFIGEMLGVRSLPITFEANGKKRSLKIPSVVDLEIQGIQGEGQTKETTIENVPMTMAPGFPTTVAKSVKHTYSDHGLNWDNSGKNGFYARFAYSS